MRIPTLMLLLLISMLAHTAQAQGRQEEAEKIYQWALDVSEKTLGPESANTAFLRNQYGKYLRAHGRDEETDRLSDG